MAVLGLAVFSVGLTNPFLGDDNFQIVNSPPVHSIENIGTLLSSSTFYNGQELVGSYYRPMMTIVYAFLYSLFGPQPSAFHMLQLALHIANAFILFLFLKNILKPIVSVGISLIFLLHPLNSQVVYSIPALQDALFFFFGILALWILATKESNKYLWTAAGLMLLSLLSKEIAVVFPLIASLFLFFFDREKLKPFIFRLIGPIALYLLLRFNAVGLIGPESNIAPIADLSFIERLMTIPSIILFYVTKFILPWDMASRYYWTITEFSINQVLVPLTIVLLIIFAFFYLGYRSRKYLGTKEYKIFVYFSIWTSIGLIPYLQIFPLDMTANINWFYFTMVGVLGMLGISLQSFKWPLSTDKLAGFIILLLAPLGASSFVQGTYFREAKILASHDYVTSKNNFAALNDLAQVAIGENDFKQAETYARMSVDIYPSAFNYQNLGVALQQQGDYSGARDAYTKALRYTSLASIYENLSLIALIQGDHESNIEFFHKALKEYPTNSKILLYLALQEASQGSDAKAKEAITKSAEYGTVPSDIYIAIINSQPYTLRLPNTNKVIQLQ